MWIRSLELRNNPQLKSLIQLLLRTHSFVWYYRHRMIECKDILFVRIVNDYIVVYHTFESEIYKSYAYWTRMKIPSDLDLHPIYVHMMEYPLHQVYRVGTYSI